MPERPLSSDDEVAIGIRRYADERRLSSDALGRWLALTPSDAAALLSLAERLRLGENQLTEFWNWSEEIAVRERCCLSDVLASEGVCAALAEGHGRNDTLVRVRSVLRRLRFPQLCRAEEEASALVRALALPRSVRVRIPQNLDSATVRLEISADSAAALRAAVAQLGERLSAKELDRLFALLDGDTPA